MAQIKCKIPVIFMSEKKSFPPDHEHNTVNHGQTWLAMKNHNDGTMVNLDFEEAKREILKMLLISIIHSLGGGGEGL